MKNYEHSIDWLLDPADPGVRYLALRDIVEGGARDLDSARARAHKEGPIAHILDQMQAGGYWLAPGPGYNPKYRATVWSIVLLAQLGASIGSDRRLAMACSSLMEHSLAPGGRFSADGTPSGSVDCLQGNLLAALLSLGYEDSRLATAFDWMARSVTGEGVAPLSEKASPVRYYAGKCGPNFACGSNNKLPCAWGGVKVMLAFSKLPGKKRTLLIDRAINAGVSFLFSKDPAEADYPSGWAAKPSGNWWKFGFPVFYVTDLLQNVEALVGLGYGSDPRLARALEFIRAKQDSHGRWPMEYDYAGKTWLDFGTKKDPNKWVTLRALKVLKAVGDLG